MPAPTAALKRSFELDSGVLIPGSATKLTFTGDSPMNLIKLVEANKPLDDDYEIGKIAVSLDSAASGEPLRFNVGSGSVDVTFSAGASVGVGVYSKPTTVIDRLGLKDDGPQPDVSGGQRYVLFRGAYDLKAHAEGTHPIGAIGALTFDSSASRNKVFAVVHRVPEKEGAWTSFDRTFSSLRLPGQFTPSDVSELQPGTMLIAEANGMLAMNVAAQVGYSFSFLRELEEIGLTGQIGLHIESGLKVSLGFQVAGRYLVVLDRKSQEETESKVRLQVLKLRQRGWNFGLNLSVTVTPETEALPDNADDLVRATFGLHGRQIIDELNQIEEWLGGLTSWTESKEEFNKHAAGFLSGALADLVETTTGKDPKTHFNEARNRLNNVLQSWDALPETVSAQLWGLAAHGGLNAGQQREFKKALKVIAEPGNEDQRREFINSILTRAGFDSLPISGWLKAASEKGLASLLADASALQPIAANTLAVLDGKFVENLQRFVSERLNLDQLREAVEKFDYGNVDAWLQRRLARFVGKLDLPVEELHEVASAVVKLLDQREAVYQKVRQALAKRRDFTFAVDYEAKTAKTALIDAEFDLSEVDAQRLLEEALKSKKYDRLLVGSGAKGVTLQTAVLTHEISRKKTVEVSMPFFSMKETKLTESLARVTASQPASEGGRVLFYELDSSNEDSVRDRLRGRLMLAASVQVPLGDNVRVFSDVDGGLSYEYREANEHLKLRELDRRIKPAIRTYLPKRFPSTDSLNEWIADLNLRTDVATGTGLDRIGDTLFSLDLSLPGEVISAWLQPRTKEELKAAKLALSLALQRSVKDLIPRQYFSRLKNFQGNAVDAPLLLWAAMPPSTSFRVRDGAIEADGKSVYWDPTDIKERRALIEDPRTGDALARSIADAHERLTNAGLDSRAEKFLPGQSTIDRIVADANWKELVGPSNALLLNESKLVKRAAKALDEVAEFVSETDARPSEAIAALSKFGAMVTKTFNSGMGSVYGSKAIRPLGTRIFLDGAQALEPSLAGVAPTALMSLTVLNQNSGFEVESFLADESPAPELVAAEERLTSPPAVS